VAFLNMALRGVVGLAWIGVAASSIPVVKAIRGDFRTEVPDRRATGLLMAMDYANSPPTIQLDSATAVIFVYSAKCAACEANTDNWLRLRAALREHVPRVPVIAVPAPQDRIGRPEVPSSLHDALPEYRLKSGTVRLSLGVDILPATVVVSQGRVRSVSYGIVGPRRRARLVNLVKERADD
jgi:hypothetical protein